MDIFARGRGEDGIAVAAVDERNEVNALQNESVGNVRMMGAPRAPPSGEGKNLAGTQYGIRSLASTSTEGRSIGFTRYSGSSTEDIPLKDSKPGYDDVQALGSQLGSTKRKGFRDKKH